MPTDRPSELLGQLPRTRPHRRSSKRPAKPAAAQAKRTPARTAQAKPTPARTAQAKPAPAQPKRTPAQAKAAGTASKPAGAKRTPVRSARSERLPQPAQPGGVPATRRTRPPVSAGDASTSRPNVGPIIGTAVQAAAEIAEIGLALSTKALRRAVGRFPRP